MAVRDSRHGQGIGTVLYRYLMDQAESLQANALRIRLRHSEGGAVAWFERRGFTVMQRMITLVLNLSRETPSLEPLTEQSVRQGIVLINLTDELRRHPNCVYELHDLRNLCFADIPTADPSPLPGFKAFQQMMDDPTLLPDAFFIAKAGDEYVGLSNLAADQGRPDRLNQWFTGVHPDCRQRGIALALKAMTVRYALQRGYRTIVTVTNAINTVMLRINRRLGFLESYTEIRMGRESPWRAA